MSVFFLLYVQPFDMLISMPEPPQEIPLTSDVVREYLHQNGNIVTVRNHQFRVDPNNGIQRGNAWYAQLDPPRWIDVRGQERPLYVAFFYSGRDRRAILYTNNALYCIDQDTGEVQLFLPPIDYALRPNSNIRLRL